MKNNLNLLGQLKDKLVNEPDFNETMKYFFDNFAENEAFIQLGDLYKSKFIETMITHAASKALGQQATVKDLMLTRLPAQKFCHGPCFVNGRMATLFYFEDIRTGLLAIVMNGSGEMRYTRLTAVAIQEQPPAKWN